MRSATIRASRSCARTSDRRAAGKNDLPAYAIDHEHSIHQLEDAEYYHPTKIEIISEIGDALCRKLGGHPFARAEE